MQQPSKRSVLIIEDSPDLMHYFKLSFETLGWEVRTAMSVKTASVELTLPRPSIILCDLQLPDGSGHEVLSLHRKLLLTTPFYFMSSNDRPASRQLSALGISGYFVKPFMVKDVIAELTRSADLSAA